MIRLGRIDHVGLRVADLDEAAARWCIQLGLVERPRGEGRAYLACNDEPYCLELVSRGGAGARPHRVRAPHDLLAGRRARRTSSRPASASRSARGRSGSQTRTGAGSSCSRTARPRRRSTAGPSMRDPPRRCTSAARGGSATSTASRVTSTRTRRSTPMCSACGSPTGSATAGVWFHVDSEHHVMALVDLGYAHFHHLAFDVVDIGKMRDLLDHLARHGRWVSWGPARHGIAGNIATYVRIVEEPCHVELYCDMERLADDHVPRTTRTTATRRTPGARCRRGRTSASTRSRSSGRARAGRRAGGRCLRRRSRRDAQGLHRPAHARGALLARPLPAVALRRRVPRDRLLGRPRQGGRLSPRGDRPASRPRPLRVRRGRLAVVLGGRRRARRPVALAVQGGVRRLQRPARRRGGHGVLVHLGRPRLRAHARLDPGLPEEARLDLDHPQLRARRAGRSRDGAGRALRRDVRRLRAPRRAGNGHARAPVGGRAVPQRAADRQRPPLPAARRGTARRTRRYTSSFAPCRATGRPRRCGRGARRSSSSARRTRRSTRSPRCGSAAGYRFTFAYTVDDLETVRELGA